MVPSSLIIAARSCTAASWSKSGVLRVQERLELVLNSLTDRFQTSGLSFLIVFVYQGLGGGGVAVLSKVKPAMGLAM